MQLNQIYDRQRLALAPFTTHMPDRKLTETFSEMGRKEKDDFFSFLMANNLGSAWSEKLGWKTIETLWTPEQIQHVAEEKKRNGLVYRQQIAALYQIARLLEKLSIPHAFIKGAHTREIAYTNPVTRPSVDLDLLIAETDREEVIASLKSQGYTLHVLPNNLTHEASLVKGCVSIDLHWHILRPGRVPKTLTSELLDNRVKQIYYWSLGNEDHLFTMLVHSVFSKYSSTMHSGLIRLLDLLYWLGTQPIEWQRVVNRLERTGLKSAAWITVEYLRLLTGVTPPQQVMDQLLPGKVKERYLNTWIHADLPSRLERWPFIVKMGFTLFAHDRPGQLVNFARTFFFDKLAAK
ncbi:nucleotidyltransferase family protein [Desulfofustis limnaeus]|uniref:Nucleotidyltransferase family protein n=1 Tax=Desulfofustis limnaeus TaxID=2740163 RepID=A0ABN6M451_9BACT|nr:nucleotidyltransferase family protein [Desulfofustis limnaeus]BDD87656.1 hypothetical protein DPPLL_20210 [Desulfofustis limnaeus]